MEHWSDTSRLQKATPRENGSTSTEVTEHPDDTTQQNGLAPIDVSGAGDEFEPEGVPALPSRRSTLQTFPKEFNKSYLEALDRRYAAILLLLLLLEPLLIWYLMRTYPVGMTEQSIAKLQDKYAEIFLSDFKVEQEPGKEVVYNELLLRATEQIPQIVGEVAGASPSLNLPGPPRGQLNPEARALPGEHREALRKLGASARHRGMQALAEHVERIGLLGVITSGSGIISKAPVTDILAFADSTSGDIDRALVQVKELRVPRAGVDYYGPSVGAFVSGRGGSLLNSSGDVFIAQKEVRGKRATSSGVVPEDIVTGLAVAPQKTVDRNREFENVASVPSLVPPAAGIGGLRARPVNGYSTREKETIRQLVAAHNPAIQDCYRRQLKGNAALKGKVTVRFVVNTIGHVIDAQVVKSEMMADGAPISLPEMEQCILGKILKWRDFGQVEPATGDMMFRQTYVFGY